MAAIDPFQIESLAVGLNSSFAGHTLLSCFSTDKEQIFLNFGESCLHLHFFRGRAFMERIASDKLPKRNCQGRFGILHGRLLQAVEAIPYDRILVLKFDGAALVLRMFGRFSQLDLYGRDGAHEAFPISGKVYPDRPMVHKRTDAASLEELLHDHPWLSQEEIGFLHQMENKGRSQFKEGFDSICRKRRSRNWKAVETDTSWLLDQVDEQTELLEELGILYRRLVPKVLFMERKDQLLRDKEKELSKLRGHKQRVERSIQRLSGNSLDKEKADLLMAYMHQLEAKDKEVVLPSFDDGRLITIKLDPRLSPQENAQRYYERSKDERKKLEYLQHSLKEMRASEERLTAELHSIQTLESHKEVKERAGDIKKKRPILPYRQVMLGMHELRVGKSARDNDELLRKHSSPHDLWFHAHAVAGSHVILRLSKGETPTESLLEQAASVAAYHSKARSEALVRVLCTYRKFVRKPKGANPGAVVVENEKSLLVEPILPTT